MRMRSSAPGQYVPSRSSPRVAMVSGASSRSIASSAALPKVTKRPAGIHERPQRLDAGFLEAAAIFRPHARTLHAVQQQRSRNLGNHDRVESPREIGPANLWRPKPRIGQPMALEDPPRPSSVAVSTPGLENRRARQAHRDQGRVRPSVDQVHGHRKISNRGPQRVSRDLLHEHRPGRPLSAIDRCDGRRPRKARPRLQQPVDQNDVGVGVSAHHGGCPRADDAAGPRHCRFGPRCWHCERVLDLLHVHAHQHAERPRGDVVWAFRRRARRWSNIRIGLRLEQVLDPAPEGLRQRHHDCACAVLPAIGDE